MIAVEVVVAWTRVVDPLGPTDIDPDDARDRACDVTTSSRLCDIATPEPDRPPVDPFDAPNAGAAGGVLGWLLMILLAALLIVALVWLVMRWMDGSHGSDDDDTSPTDVDESLDAPIDARVVDHETPPDRWRRLAADAREAGDHREAVRCQYRALVGDLARAGYVDEIPGRTSGEERQQVAEIAPRLGDGGGDVAHHFAIAADTFDTAWFDDAVVTAADDQRFVAAERAVLDVVLTGSARRTSRRSAET